LTETVYQVYRILDATRRTALPLLRPLDVAVAVVHSLPEADLMPLPSEQATISYARAVLALALIIELEETTPPATWAGMRLREIAGALTKAISPTDASDRERIQALRAAWRAARLELKAVAAASRLTEDLLSDPDTR